MSTAWSGAFGVVFDVTLTLVLMTPHHSDYPIAAGFGLLYPNILYADHGDAFIPSSLALHIPAGRG